MARGLAVTGAQLREIMKKRRRGRYRVAPKPKRTVDGIVFASKREADTYVRLKKWRDDPNTGGTTRTLLRQVPFHLPGGVRYVADFLPIEFQKVSKYNVRLGVHVFLAYFSVIDAKGHPTEMYKLKKKQVAAVHGIEIQEV